MQQGTAEKIEIDDTPPAKCGDIDVLLVEDDADDVFLMTRALKASEFNIELTVCRNGREALDHLQQNSTSLPNVIFLDLNMPVMDGREFLKELRKDHGLDSLPVVVITTSKEPEIIKEAYKLGANSVVSKASTPDGMEELMRTVTQYWFKTSGIFYVD